MNPLRIRAANYRSFRDLDLHLPAGPVAIIGPNGAGKSSVVNAVELALFGPQSRNLGDYLTDGEAALMVELEFEHRGDLYRARRSYSAAGRGSTKVDFERFPERLYDFDGSVNGATNSWEPLTRETAAATQELICQTIGLSRETFRASAFLRQGDGAAFTEASPRDRKSILAECVGLARWDLLHERVKQDRANAEQDVSRATLLIETATEELRYRADTVSGRDLAEHHRVALASDLDADLALVATWEDRLADARAVHEKRAAVQERCLTAQAARTGNMTRSQELTVERVALAEAAARRPQLEQQAEILDALEAEHADLVARSHAYESAERERRQAVADHERLTIERTRLQDEANALDEKARADEQAAQQMEDSDTATCPTCEQPVKDDAKRRAVSALLDAAGLGAARAITIRGQAHDLELLIAEAVAASSQQADAPDAARTATVLAQLRAARDARTELAALQVKQQRLDQIDAELARLQDERPSLERALADATADLEALGDAPAVASVQASLDEAKTTAERRRAEISQVEKDIASHDTRLERYAALDAQIVEQRETIKTAQAELDLCVALERAYGRDGIPALIVENAAIPQIEAEANRILVDLGTSYRVELQTQRALKSGDGLRDTLDIVVYAENGARPYETFSGGERTRLNLALRIALARLLAHRRGAEVRCLCIDEPEYLDQAGSAALVGVLQDLYARGEFDRLILITHHADLRDAFESTITVQNVGGLSTLETGEREVVAA